MASILIASNAHAFMDLGVLKGLKNIYDSFNSSRNNTELAKNLS